MRELLHCQVNCQFATDRGSSFQISCTKVVEPGTQAELRMKTYDKGTVIRVTGGGAECIRPLEDTAAIGNDDEDIASLTDAAKMRERAMQQMPPEARRMFEQMQKR